MDTGNGLRVSHTALTFPEIAQPSELVIRTKRVITYPSASPSKSESRVFACVLEALRCHQYPSNANDVLGYGSGLL